MSVSLKFTFDNIDEAQAFLAGKIAGSPTQPVVVATPAIRPADPIPAPVTATEVAAAATTKGKGKGKKTESVAPDAEVASTANSVAAAPAAPESAPTPAAEPTALTPEHVRAALLKVSDKFGAEGFSKVAEVLAPFGIQKVKDIKPEQYAEVVAAAEKLAA